MTPEVSFRPEAQAELLEAQEWYDHHVPGLGLEFARTVDATIAAIQRFPEGFAQVYGEFRQCVLRRFPYSLVYRLTPSAIIVIAVHHQRKAPESWRKRTA